MLPSPHMDRLVLAGCILAGCASGPVRAESEAADSPAAGATPRLTMVILPFENKAGDPDQLHWSYATAGRISKLLRTVGRLRVIPGSKYGLRSLDIEAGAPIGETQARRIGELTEARWVVSGSWEKPGEEWRLATRLLRTAGDGPAVEIVERGGDWFQVMDRTVDRLLESLQVKPREGERRRMAERPTDSFEAYELGSRARLLQWRNGSHAEIEVLLRKAVGIDPDCWEARGMLAACLVNRGKRAEGVEMLRQLIEDEPERAEVRMLAGGLLLLSEQADAEEELLEAIRLDPDSDDAHRWLSVHYSSQGRWEDAVAALLKARDINPFDSETHARLGYARLRTGDPEAGLASLQEAERLSFDDINTELRLGLAYRALSEPARAARHFEKTLTLGNAASLDPDMLESVRMKLQSVKERLSETTVEADRPRVFSPVELRAELANLLTPEELAMAEIPFEISPEMKAWAREQTADAPSDIERAKTLFSTLAKRVQGRGKGGSRTALEAFAAWDAPDARFSCQEYAKLFVGLGRAIGLDAFYVHLEKDYKGRIVYHDCAALFVDDQALLVDPAYRWFGVPHRQFEILDDLQTIAHHAFQGRSDGNNVARCRVAVKLHPDHAWGQLCMASAYAGVKDLELAEQHLAEAARLEPGRWDWFKLKGLIAGLRGDHEEAVRLLREARTLRPEDPELHFHLAAAFSELSDPRQALASFRDTIRHDDGDHDEMLDEARKQVAFINETLAMVDGDETAVSAIRRRAEAGDAQAQHNLALHYTSRPDPDFLKAERWARRALAKDSAGTRVILGVALMGQQRFEEAADSLRQAVELAPDSANAYFNLGNALLGQGKGDQALGHYQRAVKLDPGQAGAWSRLCTLLHDQGRSGEAADVARRATELHPSLAPAWMVRGSVLYNEKKWSEAIPLLRKATGLNPDLALAWALLGGALSNQGDPDEAVAPLQKSIDLDPSKAVTWDWLGVTLSKLGQLDQAVAAWEKAIELDPGKGDYMRRLARIHFDAGQPERAGYWVTRLSLVSVRHGGEGVMIAAINRALGELGITTPVESPPDEAVREFFENHRSMFDDSAVHLRTIAMPKTTATREGAEALRGELAAGGEFAAAATAQSEDWAASAGGDRGWIKRGDLRPDLEQAAFALPAGGLSGVLEDATHYYILQAGEIRPGGQVKLDTVRGQVVARMENEQRAAMIRKWIAEVEGDLDRAAETPPGQPR